MKAKISKKALALLKNPQASKALVKAVVNHATELSNGEAVPFTISINDGDSKRDIEVTVSRVTLL